MRQDRRHAAGRIALALCSMLLAGACAATPAKRSTEAKEPIPPDAEAITVYGRYYPSLESLAPAGVQIGDLAMQDDRLVIHVRAKSERAGNAFERALERSAWYRSARREPLDPAGARTGEYVLSVQPGQ